VPVEADRAPRAADRTADSVRNALSSFVAGQRSAGQATPVAGLAPTSAPAPTAGPATAGPATAGPATAGPATGGHATDGQATNGTAPEARIDLTEPQAPALATRRRPAETASDTPPRGNGTRPEPSRAAASPLTPGIPTAVRVSTATASDGLAVSLPVSPLTPGVTLAKGATSASPSVAGEPAPDLTSSGLRRRVRGAQLPEMTLPPVTARPPDRTAESVRAALANFTAGRRSAVDSSD
jgi:hypothetical protein